MNDTPSRIKVLVIDDSALMRKLLVQILERDPAIEVVGTALDPIDAREKIKVLHPDVLTLDIEMPRMDGLTFLRNLMRLRPMPVVMISSLTDRGADATLTALEIGAVDYVSKPKLDLRHGLEELALTIAEKVKGAASARVTPSPERGPASVGTRSARSITSLGTTDRLIAIGSSTGGTEAVAQLLSQCPPDAPGIVIAQHIPEVFSQRWAVRMDRESAIVVAEAKDGDQILIGHAYVAPGGRHLRVERSGAKYFCRIGDDAPVNRHRPSVDVLFHSVAEQVGRNAVGVILTGMGADGADGLLQMSRAGCPTVAQDRESSVVWGMPGEAVKRGAVSEVVPLGVMTKRLLDLARAL